MQDASFFEVGRTWCFRHRVLGDWLCEGPPTWFESCGLCKKVKPKSQYELDSEQRQSQSKAQYARGASAMQQ